MGLCFGWRRAGALAVGVTMLVTVAVVPSAVAG